MKKNIFIVLTFVLFFGCAPAVTKKEAVTFYPPPPQEPKLQFLLSITREDDLGKKHNVLDEFLFGEEMVMKEIGRPADISASMGKIYISDRKYKKILVLDLEKKSITAINDARTGALSQPSGIWVTEDDHKYIADWGRKQILVFDADNNFLKAYGSKGQFDKPVDVAVYENRIYVCDFNKHMIFVVDKDTGETVREIGGEGKEEGRFFKPTHVIADREGNIYVNDNFNFRVQKLGPKGQFKRSYGYLGDNLGAFARPKGVDIDREGYIYIADAAFENVQIFDAETSELLLFFGGPGPHPGSMYLPAGLYIDYENVKYFHEYVDRDFKIKYLVYVVNQYGNNKLNVYAFGEWTGGALPDIEKKDAER